jgi:hypothetical protein
MDCYSCGLPDVSFKAKIRLRAENSFRRGSNRTLPFCNEECARQTMFVQLETRSTRETVTRFMGGYPITYAEFRKRVAVEAVGQSDRAETIAETRINTEPPEAENGKVDLTHGERVSERSEAVYRRVGGRPRKWVSEAERMRAYRQSQREAPELAS